MDTRLAQFVHGLYFDIQTIEGVRPLEIWNGIRELDDPYETTRLVKNLYKIVVPLVNEGSFGLPFKQHSRRAKDTVMAVIAWFSENPDARIFERFPYPPTGDGDQKELYRMVKARAGLLLEKIDLPDAGEPPQGPSTQALSQGVPVGQIGRHAVKNGVWSETIEWPPASVNQPLVFQVLATALGQTVTINYPLQVSPA